MVSVDELLGEGRCELDEHNHGELDRYRLAVRLAVHVPVHVLRDRDLNVWGGRFTLRVNPDGTLALHDGEPIVQVIATNSHLAALAVQHDGNLVIHSDPNVPNPSKRKPLWATDTDGQDVAALRLDDDGQVKLIDSAGTTVVRVMGL